MLKQLHIRDFAIIPELELLYKPGMTVLTGETGAGKSILVDALGLIMGDRADTMVIRKGCNRTEITALFDIKDNHYIFDILEKQALETENNELLIRRIISKEGPSRAFVNNSPVTAQLLRDIAGNLVDIHGQHAHQSLTRRDIQCDLLDEYGDLASELASVQTAFTDWNNATSCLETLHTSSTNQDSALSLLQYQVDELTELQPVQGEVDNLEEEFKRLSNANRLLETTQKAYYSLYDDNKSVHSNINHTLAELSEIQQFDESLENILQTLNEASVQINEAANELRSYLDNLQIDPELTQTVEKRLTAIHDMARKHQIKPQQLTEHLNALKKQLNDLENNQQLISELQEQQSLALKQYTQAANKLSQARKQTAIKMAKDIVAKLQKLGMPDSQFSIVVDNDDDLKPRLSGKDQIEFLVSTNPGQPLQPLRKVASGGELSRISLAIRVICSGDKGITSFIFDEVDAGIGGGVAEIVGKLLRQVAMKHQVLCVTHLAQIAAQADHHLQVKKTSNKTSTETSVKVLEPDERIEEIARMLAGVKITEQSRKHAQEMLSG